MDRKSRGGVRGAIIFAAARAWGKTRAVRPIVTANWRGKDSRQAMPLPTWHDTTDKTQRRRTRWNLVERVNARTHRCAGDVDGYFGDAFSSALSWTVAGFSLKRYVDAIGTEEGEEGCHRS